MGPPANSTTTPNLRSGAITSMGQRVSSGFNSRRSSQSSLDIKRANSPKLYRYNSSSSTATNTTSKGNIKVCIRPRPHDRESPWTFNQNEIYNDDLGNFQYDHIFDQYDNEEDIYLQVAEPVINECLLGFNGTIFAYGMTGSGKTHSMQSLVHKSIEKIFTKQGELSSSSSSSSPDIFNHGNQVQHVKVSLMEIYNEKLIDLLSTEQASPSSNGRKSSLMSNRSTSDFFNKYEDLRIVEDATFGVKVVNLKEMTTYNAQELIDIIQLGEKSRKIDSTDYNERSSRSHLIIQLKVALINANNEECVSVVNFCDLAGSERLNSKIDRRKEGSFINKSLLALGTVIMKLSQNDNDGHIPYRDSKLTRLLQPSLSGGSIVSILCTIHLSNSVMGETLNTLRFASRAKNVLLNIRKPTQNIVKDIAVLIAENERLLEENQQLKMTLMESKSSSIGSPLNSPFIETKHFFGDAVAAATVGLGEQIEHMKRMNLDEEQEEEEEGGVRPVDYDIILLQQEIGTLSDFTQRERLKAIIANIESTRLKERHQLQSNTSYVAQLENKVRMLEMEMDSVRNRDDLTLLSPPVVVPTPNKELQQQLADLQAQLVRKNAMIAALQSAGRLQDKMSANKV